MDIIRYLCGGSHGKIGNPLDHDGWFMSRGSGAGSHMHNADHGANPSPGNSLPMIPVVKRDANDSSSAFVAGDSSVQPNINPKSEAKTIEELSHLYGNEMSNPHIATPVENSFNSASSTPEASSQFDSSSGSSFKTPLKYLDSSGSTQGFSSAAQDSVSIYGTDPPAAPSSESSAVASSHLGSSSGVAFGTAATAGPAASAAQLNNLGSGFGATSSSTGNSNLKSATSSTASNSSAFNNDQGGTSGVTLASGNDAAGVSAASSAIIGGFTSATAQLKYVGSDFGSHLGVTNGGSTSSVASSSGSSAAADHLRELGLSGVTSSSINEGPAFIASSASSSRSSLAATQLKYLGSGFGGSLGVGNGGSNTSGALSSKSSSSADQIDQFSLSGSAFSSSNDGSTPAVSPMVPSGSSLVAASLKYLGYGLQGSVGIVNGGSQTSATLPLEPSSAAGQLKHLSLSGAASGSKQTNSGPLSASSATGTASSDLRELNGLDSAFGFASATASSFTISLPASSEALLNQVGLPSQVSSNSADFDVESSALSAALPSSIPSASGTQKIQYLSPILSAFTKYAAYAAASSTAASLAGEPNYFGSFSATSSEVSFNSGYPTGSSPSLSSGALSSAGQFRYLGYSSAPSSVPASQSVRVSDSSVVPSPSSRSSSAASLSQLNSFFPGGMGFSNYHYGFVSAASVSFTPSTTSSGAPSRQFASLSGTVSGSGILDYAFASSVPLKTRTYNQSAYASVSSYSIFVPASSAGHASVLEGALRLTNSSSYAASCPQPAVAALSSSAAKLNTPVSTSQVSASTSPKFGVNYGSSMQSPSDLNMSPAPSSTAALSSGVNILHGEFSSALSQAAPCSSMPSSLATNRPAAAGTSSLFDFDCAAPQTVTVTVTLTTADCSYSAAPVAGPSAVPLSFCPNSPVASSGLNISGGYNLSSSLSPAPAASTLNPFSVFQGAGVKAHSFSKELGIAGFGSFFVLLILL